jgi:8-oxo-dGTP diphosphatase
MKIEYVLGFAFSDDCKNVVLIKKENPSWQRDRLNGVGGKVEIGESLHESMVREYKEETGVETTVDQWKQFGQMESDTWVVYCFSCINQSVFDNSKTTEKEEVIKVVIDNILTNRSSKTHISNIPWLLTFALDFNDNKNTPYAVVQYKM